MQDYLISRINTFSLSKHGLTVDNLLERSAKQHVHVPDSDTLIICLPGWRQPFWHWGIVKNHAINHEESFLAYQFPGPILSDDKDLTSACFEKISEHIREDIKQYKSDYGYKHCVLVCLSLSSSYGSAVYKNNEDIDEVVLIAPGENLARDMWYGCRSQHLKKSYERQGIGLDELMNAWNHFSSENNLPSPRTKISLYYGGEDRVIPYKYSRVLADKLKSKGFELKVKVFSGFGHYLVSCKFLFQPSYFINRPRLQRTNNNPARRNSTA